MAELLGKYALSGTFYVPIRNAEGKPTMPGSSVRVLSEAGFELGAHTLSHIPLSGIEAGRLRTEVLGSKLALEDLTGGSVKMFCYPKGRFDRHTLQCVHEAGYSGARTTRVLVTGGAFRRYEMPTTIQAYPTRPAGYLRNLVRRLAFSDLYSYGTTLRKYKSWVDLGKHLFDRVLQQGGIWHLYGHSWELEELQLWDELKEMLAYVARRNGVHYVSNSGVLDALSTDGR